MEPKQTPFKAGVNAGLILGIVSIILTFVFYFLGAEQLVSTLFQVVSLVVSLGLVIYFGIQYRKSIGGYMEFGAAFNFSFVTLVVGALISVAGMMILYFVVDPALPGVMADATLEKSMAMMESFGVADAMTSDQIDEMRKSVADGFTPLGMLKGQLFMLIGYAIIALILGAILKKRDKSLDY
ncbi:DUF4199 domain-containing protein [Belliella sp. DSM 111904]|uniref:DUF4199 domain-containing protein n=1 Tax=Belliella filtrata TaxID=2923435 RepID=A0ABS9V3P3_9BACT|nr:DUF4199 domain-containing protein [Belliella filtrata]MCH7410805.1 DUF4199 domain-containing protein [Belliella filtrata]